MASFVIEPVGYVHNDRTEIRDDYWGNMISRIELTESFGSDALLGLDQFSHVEVLFYFDKVDTSKISRGARHPRNNPKWPEVGIFARRGKNRPNRIGATITEIVKVEGTSVWVRGLDAIDGTPVIDMKAVLRAFLPRSDFRQPEWADEIMADYWK